MNSKKLRGPIFEKKSYSDKNCEIGVKNRLFSTFLSISLELFIYFSFFCNMLV